MDACVSTLVDVDVNGYMSTLPANLVGMSEPEGQMGGIPVMSVSNVAQSMRTHINALPPVWIEGQLASWNIRNGHAYAKLKDVTEDATISITVWRSVLESLTEQFAQGDKVRVLAKPDYWVAGGTLSFSVKDMRHEGLGDILEKIERLRRQLASEGLLDAARKKPLPFLPLCIGLITGANSDAEKDVLTNARLRWSDVQFRVVHTAVQGENCAPQVARAIAELDADPEVDVIIIARGGGSAEDLLPFSDETLCRAIAACRTPVVSAVGHEPDNPLCDLVADVRAATPTDAAKKVVPDAVAELMLVSELRSRGGRALRNWVGRELQGLRQLRNRPVLADPMRLVTDRTTEINRAREAARRDIRRSVAAESDRVGHLGARLNTLGPAATLARGYAVVQRIDGATDGSATVLRSVADAPAGAQLRIRVSNGALGAVSTGREEGTP